jgi:predicted hydrocarbon binding protein
MPEGTLMNRKEFFTKAFQTGLVSCSFLLGAKAKGSAMENKSDKISEAEKKLRKFREEWIQALLKNLDTQFDKESRIRFMEANGRECARREAVKIAQDCRGDMDKFVQKMGRLLGPENVSREGNQIHLQYTRCYCPLVAAGPDRLSETYCYCSQGWVREMFEAVMNKSLSVTTLQTIKRGASTCRFLIEL